MNVLELDNKLINVEWFTHATWRTIFDEDTGETIHKGQMHFLGGKSIDFTVDDEGLDAIRGVMV